jgi:broad specificity phosphatase PhoE
VEILLLARHAEAGSNVEECTSGIPPGEALSPAGRNEARALGRALSVHEIDLCATSEFQRARETADIALVGRDVPRLVLPELNEIGFGSFDGRPLAEYRRWAWEAGPGDDCPGDGETRASAARRTARALELLLARPEATILAVTHAVIARYVLDAADGLAPRARLLRVPHAEAVPLEAPAVRRAADLLAEWSEAPVFREPEAPTEGDDTLPAMPSPTAAEGS